MADVTIVVGTYGDEEWIQQAQRAIASAKRQPAEVIHVHGETLAKARNAGIEQAATEWVLCLDADDELAPGCVEALLAADGDLRCPAVSYVRGGHPCRPKLWPPVDLCDGNYLVVGTLVRREMYLAIGGFAEWPLYEDWAAFQLMAKAGATITQVPAAVYIAHVRPDSRNRAQDLEYRRRMHHEIRRANYPELYESVAA